MTKPNVIKSADTQDPLKRLAKLPRLPELVLVGGKRQVNTYIRENKQYVQPQLALWLEESGFIRSFQLISPLDTGDDGVSESLQALADALTKSPFAASFPAFPASPLALPQPKAGLPAKIIINDAAMAEAVRDFMASLDVTVEYAESIPAFDEAFRELSASLGADDETGPPEPFEWKVNEAMLPPLYKAAASYWRRAPWDYMGSDLPLSIKLGQHGPQPGVDTLYATILGNGGEVFGVAFYYSLDAFRRTIQRGEAQIEQNAEMEEQMIKILRQNGVPVDQIPPHILSQALAELAQEYGLPGTSEEEVKEAIEDGMVLFFDFEEESDPTYLEWLAERNLKYPSAESIPSFFRTLAQNEFRDLNEREVGALTLALEALNQFFSANRKQLDRWDAFGFGDTPVLKERIIFTAHSGEAKAKTDRLAVEVKLPPEDL